MSRSAISACPTYASTNFDFSNMSMHHQRQSNPVPRDYFNSKLARGSSPTASLTADLDANFHIDKRYCSLFDVALEISSSHSTQSSTRYAEKGSVYRKRVQACRRSW